MEYMEQQMQTFIEAGINEADRCYARIAELEEQNAALAAQVEVLREMANRANVHLTKGYAGQSFSAIDCNLALSALAEIDSFTPQRHLAEIRAQAGRDGFIEGVRQEMLDRFGLFYHDTIDRANQYADSIRQEKK